MSSLATSHWSTDIQPYGFRKARPILYTFIKSSFKSFTSSVTEI
jgi:hypothetical protein